MSRATTSRDAEWLNQSAAARRIGLSPSMLSRLARRVGGLYAPASVGLPGQAVGRRPAMRYHARQVEILSGVMLGELSWEDGCAQWDTERALLGARARLGCREEVA